MKLSSVIVLCLIVAALLATLTVNAPASNRLQETTSISFTVTTTTNYQMTTGGSLQVKFNSIQVDGKPPQSYSFGVSAKTSPGQYITRLHWEFGDGAFLDVPYCCQSQVSEVQNHAYAQPGSYTVAVVAFDNMGNFGNALVTVNWVTPVPEYPNYGLPLLISFFVVLAAASIAKGKGKHISSLLR